MANTALLRVEPAFGGVEWLHATYTTHAFDMHMHSEYVIAIVDEGAEVFRCRGETHVAPVGTIYTINPGEPHDGRAAGTGWRYRAFYPSAGFIERALGGRAARNFGRTVWRNVQAARLLSSMHKLFAQPSCALARQAAIVETLGGLFAANGSHNASTIRTKSDQRIEQVREILCDHYGDAHTLESLGAEIALHPNYLLSAFKRRYGVTPAVFLRAERLSRAKAMIRAGQPLKSVAQDTGFFDQAHFTRCFKRGVGATPSVYAAACGLRGTRWGCGPLA